MKTGKIARQLPTRGGLYDLADKAKAGATINDYSKASPLKPAAGQPAAIIGLARKSKR